MRPKKKKNWWRRFQHNKRRLFARVIDILLWTGKPVQRRVR